MDQCKSLCTLVLLCLSACSASTDSRDSASSYEYRQADEYHKYMDRRKACRGIWVTTFPHDEAARQHPVDLRRAFCARKAL